MENCGPLAWYGVLVVVAMSAFIVVPFWRGRSKLATAWNALLGGIAIYTGIGCLEAAYDPSIAFWQLDWFQPTSKDVRMYMVFVLVACAITMALSFVTAGITFFGPLINNMARKACIVATVFAFVLWYKKPANIATLGLFLGVFSTAGIYSMMISVGRRMLLSVGLGPVLAVYWITLRNWKPSKSLLAIVILGIGLFVGSAAYSNFRHFHRSSDDNSRSAGKILEQVKNVDLNETLDNIAKNQFRYFAQSNVKYSLLVRKAVVLSFVEPEPANTLYFLASYPIPRRIWSEKPMTIGRRIGHHILGLPQTVNFGVGIGGHGAFEGGPLIMIVYACLIAGLIRFIDDPMRLQPSNPFLISLLACAMPHVLALPRGDFGVMGIEIIICFIFIVPLGFVGRMQFGTVRPTTILNGAPQYNAPRSHVISR
jgi:hypothetical protein